LFKTHLAKLRAAQALARPFMSKGDAATSIRIRPNLELQQIKQKREAMQCKCIRSDKCYQMLDAVRILSYPAVTLPWYKYSTHASMVNMRGDSDIPENVLKRLAKSGTGASPFLEKSSSSKRACGIEGRDISSAKISLNAAAHDECW
jgi:hypothetical protein